MTRHHQLKNEARRAEQRSDWGRAIELYKAAIRLEDEHESGSDVGVYNRVGDLYLRQGNTAAAVEYYEQASDRYATAGLHTSAIALCNKILRIAPDRHEVYGRLARLHASTGLLAEARSAFLRFAERMRETNRLSEALEAVQDLVSLTGDEELRAAFAEQLVDAGLGAQAVAQLRLVYQARVAGGRNAQDIREKILALDPDADPAAGASPPPPRATPTPDPLVADFAPQATESAAPAAPSVAAQAPPVTPEAVVTEVRPTELKSEQPEREPGPGGSSFDVPDSPAEGDPEVESVLTRFRSQVRDIVEETDHAVHYDLGVAYMGMELYNDAIGEFRLAMQSPALMDPAHALLGECLRARGEPEDSEVEEPDLVGTDEPTLPLATTDDFMLGQSLELGVPEEPEGPPPIDGTEDPVAADESTSAASADEDELADMLFQARLAQHRARAAQEDGGADHQAHLDLGRTYERMGLITEAVRDLAKAIDGPPAVKAEALDSLERVVSSKAIEASALAEALTRLTEHGRADAAVAAGREFVQRTGIREVDRQIVLAALPEDERVTVHETVVAGPSKPAGEALAELGDILAELDEMSAEELDLDALETPLETGIPMDTLAEAHRTPAVSGAPTSPGDDPAAHFGEAEGLRAAGRMDEAESHYYRALELFEKKRDAINAIRAVDRLLGLHPDDVVLHHQKNEFAIMTNDRELLVSSYLDLAACLRRQNGFRSARTVYGRILDLDPGNAEARAGIAAVDADELARERHRQQQPKRKSSVDVASTENESTGVEVLQTSGEIDAMFQDLNTGVEEAEPAQPDYESHFELGIAFQQMEMWDEAAREFKQAVQGMKEPLQAYEHLGVCLLALRRYDEAKRTLGVAATHSGPDEDRAGVLFQLGVAHLRSGDSASARDCLERVLEIDPSRADATHLLSTLPA